MQDRFKFRVFIPDKKNSKNSLTGMFKVHSLHTGTNKAIISSLYGNCSIKLENNILMQCTGLKDKNGKLIYEGDIIDEGIKTVIEWDSERCALVEKAKNILGKEETYPLFDSTNEGQNHRMEIIGNIYENPDLLQ